MRGCVFRDDEALRVERIAETLRETEVRRRGRRSSTTGSTHTSCQGDKRENHFKLRHRLDLMIYRVSHSERLLGDPQSWLQHLKGDTRAAPPAFADSASSDGFAAPLAWHSYLH